MKQKSKKIKVQLVESKKSKDCSEFMIGIVTGVMLTFLAGIIIYACTQL